MIKPKSWISSLCSISAHCSSPFYFLNVSGVRSWTCRIIHSRGIPLGLSGLGCCVWNIPVIQLIPPHKLFLAVLKWFSIPLWKQFRNVLPPAFQEVHYKSKILTTWFFFSKYCLWHTLSANFLCCFGKYISLFTYFRSFHDLKYLYKSLNRFCSKAQTQLFQTISNPLSLEPFK